jgi:hypothetical protein
MYVVLGETCSIRALGREGWRARAVSIGVR